MIVCMCVVILRPLGKEDESAGWAGAKGMLADTSLLKMLQESGGDKYAILPFSGEISYRCFTGSQKYC
jgi:hypothetical protein